MKFKELVGHKIIYDEGKHGFKTYTELYILELSPSSKRAKIRYPSGSEIWQELGVVRSFYGGVEDSKIVEDLGEFGEGVI